MKILSQGRSRRSLTLWRGGRNAVASRTRDAMGDGWVLAELHVRDGRLGEAAAAGLERAIETARTRACAIVLVDLRDLRAMDAGELQLFADASSACSPSIKLGILLDARHSAIAATFKLAGLGELLCFTGTVDEAAAPSA